MNFDFRRIRDGADITPKGVITMPLYSIGYANDLLEKNKNMPLLIRVVPNRIPERDSGGQIVGFITPPGAETKTQIVIPERSKITIPLGITLEDAKEKDHGLLIQSVLTTFLMEKAYLICNENEVSITLINLLNDSNVIDFNTPICEIVGIFNRALHITCKELMV